MRMPRAQPGIWRQKMPQRQRTVKAGALETEEFACITELGFPDKEIV